MPRQGVCRGQGKAQPAHLCRHVADQSSGINVGELPIVEHEHNGTVLVPDVLEVVRARDRCKACISSVQNAFLVVPSVVEDASLRKKTSSEACKHAVPPVCKICSACWLCINPLQALTQSASCSHTRCK